VTTAPVLSGNRDRANLGAVEHTSQPKPTGGPIVTPTTATALLPALPPKSPKTATENAVAAEKKACFAVGTPLQTPDGWRNIEAIQAGEYVLARDEYDPSGEVLPKVVEEVFVTEGLIWHLHTGGRVVRTTAEHPFWIWARGWVPYNQLKVGDWLFTLDGLCVQVEDLLDTGKYETLYNIRVADFHTYFVGCDEWGFSVWAHNECINIALGTAAGLRAFAEKYDAKMYLDWERAHFDVSSVEPWNPKDMTGGTNSLFASAVRTAIEKSNKIYFKLDGFDILTWSARYDQSIPALPPGTITAWELYQLMFKETFSARRPSMIFVSGTTEMDYNQFKAYAIQELESVAKKELSDRLRNFGTQRLTLLR
jgi:hypothetical protein